MTKNDPYVYLGIAQTLTPQMERVVHDTCRKYQRRMHMIWTSVLSAPHKVAASNSFAEGVLSYVFFTTTWTATVLRDLDRAVRRLIAMVGASHRNASLELLYLDRRFGGRGLHSVQDLYKRCKIRAALHLAKSEDRQVVAARKMARKSASASWAAKAQKYAEELGLKLDLGKGVVTTADGKEEADEDKVGDIVRHAQADRILEALSKKSTGKLLTSLRAIPDRVETLCNAWLTSWPQLEVATERKLVRILERTVPTRVRMDFIHRRSGRASCRMCGQTKETVAHVAAGCQAISGTLYTRRHDATLRVFYWYYLHKVGIEETLHPWWWGKDPEPEVELGSLKILWNRKVYTEQLVTACKPDMLILDEESKTARLVEMSCPWDTNVPDRFVDKWNKYGDLRHQLGQEYTVSQTTLVVGALGTITRQLLVELERVTGNMTEARVLARRMQRATLSETARLFDRFLGAAGEEGERSGTGRGDGE